MDSSISSSHNKKMLKQSSTTISKSIKHKTCPICLSHISGHRPAIIPSCSHAYCLQCLLRWSNYKRTCPLCNSPFESYFSTSSSSLSSRTFQNHRLLPLHQPRNPARGALSPLQLQRDLRRRREEINAANRRSRPVPRRRSFGRVGSDVIAERVLQWRHSIYKLGLMAVPFTDRNLSNQNIITRTDCKETILHRIEPWIRRELQAILQDPDPTVVVHVVTSLYLSSLENKPGVSSRCSDAYNTFLARLQPFLQEWTNMFWHELRCFAESSFTMDTYDEVVEYRKSN